MSGRVRLAVPALVVAVVVVGLIVWVAGQESPPSASEALARAERFTARAESVEYHGEQQIRFSEVAPGEEDVEPTVFEEAAVFPDRARSLVIYDDSLFETLSVDNALYSREA